MSDKQCHGKTWGAFTDGKCTTCGEPMPEADEWNDLGIRLETLDHRARAVIAAGRPHVHAGLGVNPHIVPCPCQCCAAWDALAELLKETK